jgi:hypothetical protein
VFDAFEVLGLAFELVTEMARDVMEGPRYRGPDPAYMLHNATLREMETPSRRTLRTTWLESLQSQACFTAGVVVAGDDPLRVQPVEVVVTPEDLVLAGPDVDGDDRPEELGRIGRNRVREVAVLDAAGNRVARPSGDPLEPADVCRVALTWETGEGPHVESFLFYAPSVAWEAADRFERFSTPH